MLQRLLGVITFKASVYREIADDTTATRTAAVILVAVALIGAFSSKLYPQQESFSLPLALGAAAIAVVLRLIGWVVVGWVLSTTAAGMFRGETDLREMLRITGFTSIFGILAIFGLLLYLNSEVEPLVFTLKLVAGILTIVGNVIGVREAAGFSTRNAIVICIMGGIAAFMVTLVGVAVTTFILSIAVA